MTSPSTSISVSAAAPIAEVRPHTDTVHGHVLRDDYAWLKAENWRDVLKDPAALPGDIRAYLEAENAYSETALAGTESLRKALVAEMRARIREDDSSVPEPLWLGKAEPWLMCMCACV